MSASEEQPATVPPPPGEDDAYSAATRVGEMPADLMAQLRAEGLLPPDAQPAAAIAAAPRPVPRPPPPRPTPADSAERKAMPVLHSTAPPKAGAPASSPAEATVEHDILARIVPDGPKSAGGAPPEVDARVDVPPVAAASPPVGEPELPASESPPAEVDAPRASAVPVLTAPDEKIENTAAELRSMGAPGASSHRRVFVIVGALALLVAFAFLMALISQRR